MGRRLDIEDHVGERALGDLERVGAQRRERLARIVNLRIEELHAIDLDPVDVLAHDRASHAASSERRREIEARDPSVRHAGAENDGEQHARSYDVGGIPGTSGHFLERVHPCDALPDDVQLVVFAPWFGLEGRQLDDFRLLTSFNLDLGGDESLARGVLHVGGVASGAVRVSNSGSRGGSRLVAGKWPLVAGKWPAGFPGHFRFAARARFLSFAAPRLTSRHRRAPV